MSDALYDKFVGLNTISKTLCFELKPIGKTLANIKKRKEVCSEETPNIFENDQRRNDQYLEIKKIFDEAHKKLLQEALSSFKEKMPNCDWSKLKNAYIDYRKSDKDAKQKENLEKVQAEFREAIVHVLTQHDSYKNLTESTPSHFIKNELEKQPGQLALEVFNSFATYFTGFQENRKNIYSSKAQTTSAANRAINDNFPKFMECCRIYDIIKQKYPEIIEKAQNELADYLENRKLDDIFEIENYGSFLAQSDIDYFNTLISGISSKETERNKKGLNSIIKETIDSYHKSDSMVALDSTLSKMPQLYKQILSDRETFSYVAEAFQNDSDVVKALQNAGTLLQNAGTINEPCTNICEKMEEIENLLDTLSMTEDKVYIDNKSITDISVVLYNNWDDINQRKAEYITQLADQLKIKTEKNALLKIWDKKSEYALSDFSKFGVDIVSYWKKDEIKKVFSDLPNSYNHMLEQLQKRDVSQNMAEQEDVTASIKEFLDLAQNLYHVLKPLSAGKDLERNAVFYAVFDKLFDDLSFIVSLYNKVRNYLTKKPNETKKIKLMFDAPVLGDGWDQSKEKDDKCVIFIKDNNYYLGIIQSKKPLDFDKISQENSENCYQKMVYKYLPGPNKMLPKVFFSKKGKEIYCPSDTLLAKYNNKEHIKSSKTFSLSFCHELIDYFKQSICLNPDWQVFNFQFSPTESYQGIHEFYQEVAKQGYKVSFINISTDKIDALVEKGNLLLFQIYNKDFALGSHGHENMHTMYWRQLFSPINLKESIFQLNGGAELFYRSKSIKKVQGHHIGEKMLNRRDKNGETIPENIYIELYEYINGRSKQNLSKDAQNYLDKIVIKDVKYDIVKDKHFTEDKFLFHVPIRINWRADSNFKLNDAINNCVQNNIDNIHYIGIDRGERHLIYLSMIDSKGQIIEQKSYNIIENPLNQNQQTNYHQKLDEREKNRNEARKNWKTIDQIKDLKKGYLSQVVHDICKKVIQYNAVVILEDLNFGFKRGRFRIEKQVYQNFERALIEKLNYLVFKDKPVNEVGGVLKGYQLTAPLQTFERLGKQSGILYYVPAHYTSKIDPTTGFVNLFPPQKSEQSIKEFFGKFDSITYNATLDSFAFKFNYQTVVGHTADYKKDWCVYSAKRRLVYNKIENKTTEINPTQIIKEQLEKAHVELTDNYDLKGFMNVVNPVGSNQFFSKIYYAFCKTLQMRNSSSASGEDYIESPVLNHNNEFFISSENLNTLPQNADANGAYHIALKGLCMLKSMDEGKPKTVKNEEWFKFVQSRNE